MGNVHLFPGNPYARSVIWPKSRSGHGREIHRQRDLLRMGATLFLSQITDVTTALNTGMIDTVYAPPSAPSRAVEPLCQIHDLSPSCPFHGAVLVSRNFVQKSRQSISTSSKRSFTAPWNASRSNSGNKQRSLWLAGKGGIKILPMPQNADLKDSTGCMNRLPRVDRKLYPKDILDKVYDLLKQSR